MVELQGVVAFANFEHRASGPQAAKAVYEQALASSQQQDQQKDSSSSKRRSSGSGGGSSSSSRGFLYVLYANFLRQVSGQFVVSTLMPSGWRLPPACVLQRVVPLFGPSCLLDATGGLTVNQDQARWSSPC